MNRVLQPLMTILRNGTIRAALVLAVFIYTWWWYQLGGLNAYLINSWLVLALPLVVASVGVTLVIITRQFDLSAAGVVTVVNVLVATRLSDANPVLATLLMLALGAGIGAVNGVFVVFGKLPAIAVTLATLIILNGVALILLPLPGGAVPQGLIGLVNQPDATIPRPLLILAVLTVGWLVFKRTKLGIYMFAVGRDEEALHLSGISVPRVRIGIFAIAGALYALAGVFLSAAIQSADATIGSTYLLSTFAAIAIGGTAFMGGTGSAIGTILGGLTLVSISKVLFVVGISDWAQDIFTGVLIIAAVLVGAVTTRSENRQAMLRERAEFLQAQEQIDVREGAGR